MIFYHSTTKENYEKILKEGVLFGERNTPSRCTYLAVNKEDAIGYGEILLEVEYNPFENRCQNNFNPESWQLRVYEPISINNVKIVSV